MQQVGDHAFAAGCTLTLVLITDWLLTVAGIGDSKAVLDLGAQFLEVSPEHRVHNHLSEQGRLKKAGSYLAPIRCADPSPTTLVASARHVCVIDICRHQ